MTKKIDAITLKGKKFILPKNRRGILTTWVSDEKITEENLKFEREYNELPDKDDYLPVKILDESIASVVVLTATNKIIKNAELSWENKAQITSLFTKNKFSSGSKIIEYELLPNNFLICPYLKEFSTMQEVSDIEALDFISEITKSVIKMSDKYSKDKNYLSKEEISKFGKTGYNGQFPEFLQFAREKGKLSNEHAEKLSFYHKELNGLPQQIIHGDMSRRNIMYKDKDFLIIDPKINFGRPLEDLARFILKGGVNETGEDTIRLMKETKKILSKSEFEELNKWIYIYTVSIFSEYIHKEKTERSKLLVHKIDYMFDYLSSNLIA